MFVFRDLAGKTRCKSRGCGPWPGTGGALGCGRAPRSVWTRVKSSVWTRVHRVLSDENAIRFCGASCGPESEEPCTYMCPSVWRACTCSESDCVSGICNLLSDEPGSGRRARGHTARCSMVHARRGTRTECPIYVSIFGWKGRRKYSRTNGRVTTGSGTYRSFCRARAPPTRSESAAARPTPINHGDPYQWIWPLP